MPDSNELGDDLTRIEEILADAEVSARQLSAWEESFLDDLCERVVLYRERTRVSDKQMAVINRIEAKLYQ